MLSRRAVLLHVIFAAGCASHQQRVVSEPPGANPRPAAVTLIIRGMT